MRLFGASRADDGPREPERQRSRREEIEHAREKQYLQKLAQMIEEGRPAHLSSGPSPLPRTPKPSAFPPPDPAPAPPDEPLPTAPSTADDPFVPLQGGEVSAAGDYSYGDIVLLGEEDLAIFNRFIPEKEYDVVYMLQRDGSLAPKGIPLAAHGARVIGRLPAQMTRTTCQQMAWDRDMIVFHLYEYGDTARVPHPTVARNHEGKAVTVHHASESPERESANPLRRGRRFAVMFGERRWEAIYWGHDDQGALVAHNTTGEWGLMHLDLRRFEGSIKFLEMLSAGELAEVERGLLAASGENV
ncbi:MAG: hypothetical protein HUU25_06775 [Candidatus Sumerlaeia bacterium]|nr:hypothetical protein [Candidatus Sumerlaeia bacterium]